MTLPPSELKDLQTSLADRVYLQVSGWNLYLGDAGLDHALAIECSARINLGKVIAIRQAIEAVKVHVGGGSFKLPLARFLTSNQLIELEEILEPYCR